MKMNERCVPRAKPRDESARALLYKSRQCLKKPLMPVRTPKASLLRSRVGLSGPRRLPRSDPLLGFWHFDYRHQLQSIIIFKRLCPYKSRFAGPRGPTPKAKPLVQMGALPRYLYSRGPHSRPRYQGIFPDQFRMLILTLHDQLQNATSS